ncbi:hypothetical protein LJC12_00660, partial [Odoribacter sp. OttesenSCG-928-J03]|nr:hypothetical protein [Odoribacter sp. OttesenSCG-928-J03]
MVNNSTNVYPINDARKMRHKSIEILGKMMTLLSMFIITSCGQYDDKKYVEAFLNENRSKCFEDFKDWRISRNGDYYQAMFEYDTLSIKHFIFWQKDTSMYVRFQLYDKNENYTGFSKIYDMKNVPDSLISYYNLHTIRTYMEFMYRYRLNKMNYTKSPEQIIFKWHNTECLYLYSAIERPLESPFSSWISIDSNWYYRYDEPLKIEDIKSEFMTPARDKGE